MKKDRILYIDRLRGINILLVVMGHVITRNVINGQYSGIVIWGSTFRMPLFMFLCGYIASKVIKPKIFDKYPNFILKKTRTMLVPFFAWPLLVDNFFFQNEVNLDLWDAILSLINGGGLWFLWFLFWITMLYSFWLFLSNKFNSGRNILLDLIYFGGLLILLVGFLKLDFTPMMRQFVFYFMFYFFGVFVAKYAYLSNLLMNSKAFALAMLVFFILVGRYAYGMSSTENTLIRLFCAFTGIAVFYYLVRNMNPSPMIDKYIRHWGIHSLVIYVTHFYVVMILSSRFITDEFNQIPLFFLSALITILTTMGSMLIYKLLRMNDLFKFLLYGEKIGDYSYRFESSPNQTISKRIADVKRKVGDKIFNNAGENKKTG